MEKRTDGGSLQCGANCNPARTSLHQRTERREETWRLGERNCEKTAGKQIELLLVSLKASRFARTLRRKFASRSFDGVLTFVSLQ